MESIILLKIEQKWKNEEEEDDDGEVIVSMKARATEFYMTLLYFLAKARLCVYDYRKTCTHRKSKKRKKKKKKHAKLYSPNDRTLQIP